MLQRVALQLAQELPAREEISPASFLGKEAQAEIIRSALLWQ